MYLSEDHYCPFCHNKVMHISDMQIRCNKEDHEFWQDLSRHNYWILKYYPANLFIEETCLLHDHSNEPILKFDDITPEQGADYLKRYLALKAFT
jgi:hypothetical protein